MRRLSSTWGLFFGALFVALLSVGTLVFLYAQSLGARHDIAAVEEEIVLAKRREALNHSVRAVLASSAGERAELQSYFLTEDGAVPFIEMMEGLAKRTSVSLDIESVTESPVSEASLESVRMVLRARGGWNNIVHFLALSDAIPYLHTVSDFSLERQEHSPPWVLSLVISTYKLTTP